MWEDCNLYWAWRGSPESYRPPPFTKRIEYEDFGYQRIACAVIENGVRREVFAEQRARHRKCATTQ